MTQVDVLSARRAELEGEIAFLQRKIEINVADQKEARKLDAVRAALAQVDETLASTREALARREAKEAYTVLLIEQRSKAKRQRELTAEIAKHQKVIAGAWRAAKLLIREHQDITAGSRNMIERLYKLAEQAGNGLDPMKDIDADEGAPLDESFVRLVGR